MSQTDADASAVSIDRTVQPLIPRAILERTGGKILCITQFAIGDFVYFQNCFAALSRLYPNLRLHLWNDADNRAGEPAKWPAPQKHALHDWLDACPYFEKIHNKTTGTMTHEKFVSAMQAEHFDAVIFLLLVRPRAHVYATFAREIAPRGFVAGVKSPFVPAKLHLWANRKLDAALPPYKRPEKIPPNISNFFAHWFKLLFAIEIPPPARHSFIDIPEKWKTGAAAFLRDWGVNTSTDSLVFINTTASSEERCWPMANALELIRAMRQNARWENAWFLINSMPSNSAATQNAIDASGLARVRAFSAGDNFFQLPAMLADCDLIITVITSVAHLANAVHVPGITLTRHGHSEWKPLDADVIMPAEHNQWVDKIPVSEVMKAVNLHTSRT